MLMLGGIAMCSCWWILHGNLMQCLSLLKKLHKGGWGCVCVCLCTGVIVCVCVGVCACMEVRTICQWSQGQIVWFASLSRIILYCVSLHDPSVLSMRNVSTRVEIPFLCISAAWNQCRISQQRQSVQQNFGLSVWEEQGTARRGCHMWFCGSAISPDAWDASVQSSAQHSEWTFQDSPKFSAGKGIQSWIILLWHVTGEGQH